MRMIGTDGSLILQTYFAHLHAPKSLSDLIKFTMHPEIIVAESGQRDMFFCLTAEGILPSSH